MVGRIAARTDQILLTIYLLEIHENSGHENSQMSWIDDEPSDVLRDWLRNTHAPLEVTSPEGDIIWCNRAFEELVGYTLHEFIREDQPIGWDDLTVDRADLDADFSMSKDVFEGIRSEYQLTKQYRHKDGNPVSVIIHVMRYPTTGEFNYFLVTVHPLERGNQVALKELQLIRSQLLTVLEVISRPPKELQSELSKFLDWSDRNPKKAAFIVLMISSLLFGDRLVEVIRTLKEFLP